jgi:immune inhibitor A
MSTRNKSSALTIKDLKANWHNFFGQCCSGPESRCSVAPHPKLQKKIDKAIAKMRKDAPDGMEELVSLREQTRVGFNDGLIIPGTELPLGTPPMAAKNFALERAPLRGDVRVIVVLAEFTDQAFGAGAANRFEELFFSTGQIATGSVKEYFDDVTNGAVNIIGEVVGPYTLPQTLAAYAGGSSGTGAAQNPNARDMARDAAVAANPDVDYGPYDNDADGFVDAFVVVHAGSGAEQTGSGNDIWSHKWVMRSVFNADSTQLFAYLTIPEDARLGVCAHELGHLLFGFPDLYDTDRTSAGIGNWCLMAGGSWNGNGDTPAHPSAWCKANQGWVTVNNVTSNGLRSIPDVKNSNEVFRMWKDGGAGQEYFLVENRQRTGFDADLPGDGLLIWHIDDAISANSDENHPKVALEQADAQNHLASGANRGDGGDPYPGSASNNVFDKNSTPNSRSYAGSDTCVAVTGISASAATMTANLQVRCFSKSRTKEIIDKFRNDKFRTVDKRPAADKLRIEKRPEKPIIDKRFDRDKALIGDKQFIDDKRPEKPQIDKRANLDKPFDFDPRTRGGLGGAPGPDDELAAIDQRLDALEEAVAAISPFIDETLRPDLTDSMLHDEDDLDALRYAAETNEAQAKRLMDSPKRR